RSARAAWISCMWSPTDSRSVGWANAPDGSLVDAPMSRAFAHAVGPFDSTARAKSLTRLRESHNTAGDFAHPTSDRVLHRFNRHGVPGSRSPSVSRSLVLCKKPSPGALATT